MLSESTISSHNLKRFVTYEENSDPKMMFLFFIQTLKKAALIEASIIISWSDYTSILIEIMTNARVEPILVAKVQFHTQFQSHRLERMRNYIKPIKPWQEQTNAESEAQVAMDSFVCTEAVGIYNILRACGNYVNPNLLPPFPPKLPYINRNS